MVMLKLMGLSLFFFLLGNITLSFLLYVVQNVIINVIHAREEIRQAALEQMRSKALAEMTKTIDQLRVKLLTDLKAQAEHYVTQVREAVASAKGGIVQ